MGLNDVKKCRFSHRLYIDKEGNIIYEYVGHRSTYFQELWCLATVDGGECKETFDTYDDFEEHFCQKHLDLALFACGARGCTAQFGTVLQIFRHLAICKRRGKKIKLLKCSENALESLTVLDRAKLLAVQCCVKRAKRESELTEVNGGVTSVESDVQCSLDGMGFHNSLDDDQIHVSIIRSPEIHQMEDIESGPKAIRRKRAVTPARQAAWRLKEQMLLEQEMKKKNKPPEKTTKDTQKKQKKLPVKITDKTRISALINDDPKMKRTPSYPQTESGPSRNSAFGTVNSNMFFESTKHIVSTESRPKLLLDKTQDPMSATQKQPKVFRSSLPAGPNNSSKIHDVSCGQLSPLDLTVTRPPDYSGFLRNPVINPILHERPLPVSFIPPQSASSFIQTSDGCQNNFKTNRTLTKTNLISQPRMFSTSEVDVQQKRSYMKPRGILRTREHALQNTAKTVGQTGQMDLDILSLFSKRLKDSKTLEHVEVSTLQVKQSEKPGDAMF
ncbi:unnamed protein product [Acanthocheilonema viteae]|uniref:Uncharacterized protein n=1 Tax=Acanthocheilonema viteae TaxID=6277 RepID=A0A498SGN1_ACAVI|nr:unnamed protein product [Acanthocheilonema viteae]